ncbi:MAG: HD domain-containing protein [Thermoanaerobaculia bacterium]|nr:HD domain-containing protein [Thermoanaerobaculia bacterium]
MSHENDLLDLVLELQTLDRVPRMGYLMRGVVDAESVAEHTLHVVLLVWLLGRRIPQVDTLRAIELALLHDLAEVRTGDLPMTAAHYLPAGAKRAAEQTAARELLAPLGADGRALWAELTARETPEARFVKACDKLQLMIKVTVYEGWGTGELAEFWQNEKNFPDGGFEPVRRLFDQLRRWREERDDLA